MSLNMSIPQSKSSGIKRCLLIKEMSDAVPYYFGGCLLRWLRLQCNQKEGLGHRLGSKKGPRKPYLRPVKAQSQSRVTLLICLGLMPFST